MQESNKAKYFEGGLLSDTNESHIQMLDIWNKVLAWSGIPEEFIYKYRITDFLPSDDQFCKALTQYPAKKREGKYGYVFDRPVDDKTDKITFAIAGTFIRSEIDARVRTCKQALVDFAATGFVNGDVLILKDVNGHDESRLKFGDPSLLELMQYMQLKGKFIIFITEDYDTFKYELPNGVTNMHKIGYMIAKGGN